MPLPDGGIATIRARQADDGDVAGLAVEQCHVDGIRFAPKIEQRPLSFGQMGDGEIPGCRIDDHARPGPMLWYWALFGDQVFEG
jgi:hypothetical protein